MFDTNNSQNDLNFDSLITNFIDLALCFHEMNNLKQQTDKTVPNKKNQDSKLM